MDKSQIKLTKESHRALDLMEKSSGHIFLTGRAGTGKSTLLQHFRETTTKKIVVLAPTGVAAVNVHGQTVHSFFGFGPDITPETVKRSGGKKRIMYRNLDAIVIDEISMVRADLLDAVDAFLRLNGENPDDPFGGVQMILIGDLYQLPPVVREEDRELFTTRYPGAYFFDSKVCKNLPIRFIELTKVYRQQDKKFIEVLDAIRTDTATKAHIELLNSRYTREVPKNNEEFSVYLTTTNRMADEINFAELNKLPSRAVRVRGRVFGDFPEKQTPASVEIALKEGAQVMMVNNDPSARWVNGDIGKIVRIQTSPESEIKVELANGKTHRLRPHSWEYIKFEYDRTEDKIEPKTIGTFTQYPVRLAWAVTIHKGQGKTYDRVVVDFGTGTFAHGQAYVALSRATTLEGLVLKRPLQERDIFIDPRISEFLGRF